MSESKLPLTTTENGALAHSTTGDKNLDFFTRGTMRGVSPADLSKMFRDAWDENPEMLLQVIRNGRDCRNGKGERTAMFYALVMLKSHFPKTFSLNLSRFLEDGKYKDLLEIASIMDSDSIEYNCLKLNSANVSTDDLMLVLAYQLIVDKTMLDRDSVSKVSLAAKWAPSQQGKYDVYAKRIAKFIMTNSELCEYIPGWEQKRQKLQMDYKVPADSSENHIQKFLKIYRKEFLVPLRAHIKIVETLMSNRQWDQINYEQVPAKAMSIYKKAFGRRDDERFAEYVKQLSAGEKKVNSSGMAPHELTRKPDEVAFAQFMALVNKSRESGNLKNTIAVSDVSGSMYGIPMEVSVALGLFISLVPDESDPFYKKVITFESNPSFHNITGDTFSEMVASVKSAEWGGSTNFVGVFKTILNHAIVNKVSEDDMIKKVIVLTDMQFNEAFRGNNPYQEVQQMYKIAGYKVPSMVFWNLRASKAAFPVAGDTPGTALLSGYSAELLKGVMENISNPVDVMMNVIEDYEVDIHPDDVGKKMCDASQAESVSVAEYMVESGLGGLFR